VSSCPSRRKRDCVKRSTKWISTRGREISKIFVERQSGNNPAGLLNSLKGECVSVEPSKRRRSFAPLCWITGGRFRKFRNRHEEWTYERSDAKRTMCETVNLPCAIQVAFAGIFVFGRRAVLGPMVSAQCTMREGVHSRCAR
jgi:hypothetical protein